MLLVDETAGRAFAVHVPKVSNRADPKHYAGSVSTRAAPNGEGSDVVVGTDGALTVPAEELDAFGAPLVTAGRSISKTGTVEIVW